MAELPPSPSPSPSRAAPRRAALTYLLGLVLLVGIVALGCDFLAGEIVTREVELNPPPPPPSKYVIPPGQEGRVHELLAPIDAGALPGVEQFSFSIEGREIAVQLFNADTRGDAGCPGPKWVRTPGAMFLSHMPPNPEEAADADTIAQATQLEGGGLWLRYYWCEGEAPSGALAKLHERFSHDQIIDLLWQPVIEPVVIPEEEPALRLSGLLTPAASSTGLTHHQLSMVVLLGLSLCAVVIGFGFGPALPGPLRAPSRAPPRWVWLACAIAFVAAVVLRLALLRVAFADGDEAWAVPLYHSIFHEAHDPWVHPPLFHLVQQPWVHALDWSPMQGLGLLRAPMLSASLLALALVLVAVARRAQHPVLLLCMLPCLFSPHFAAVSQLARPYGLASLLLVFVALSLWARPSSGTTETPMVARLRWSLIILAAGLATWADILAGAVAGALVLARLLEVQLAMRAVQRELAAPDSGNTSARAGLRLLAGLSVVVVLLLAALPFAPGILEALDHHIDPTLDAQTIEALGILRPGEVRPDPDLTRRLPAFCVFALDVGMLPLGLLGLGLVVALAQRGRPFADLRVAALVPMVLMVLVVLIASTTVHVRARNVIFAPLLTAWFLALVRARVSAGRDLPS